MTLSPFMPWVEWDCSDSGALRETNQNCKRNSLWYGLLFLYHPRQPARSLITGLNEVLRKAYVSTYEICTYIASKSFKLHLIISANNRAQNVRNHLWLSPTQNLYLLSLPVWYLFHILSEACSFSRNFQSYPVKSLLEGTFHKLITELRKTKIV